MANAPARAPAPAVQPTTAIAVRDQMPEWLAKPLQQYLHNPHYELLLPSIPVNLELHPWFRMSISVVQLSPNVEDGDVFKSGYRNGADLFSPSKIGLDKVSEGAGITFFNPRRIDDGKDRDYCFCEITGRVRTASGEIREHTDVKDFHVSSWAEDAWKNRVAANDRAQPQYKKTEEQVKAAHDAEVISFRKHLLARTMTGARTRVARVLLPSVVAQRTAAKIAIPKVTVRFDFQGDMNDPQVKAFMLEKASVATQALYGTESLRSRSLGEAEEVLDDPPDPDEEEEERARAAHGRPAERAPGVESPATAAPINPGEQVTLPVDEPDYAQMIVDGCKALGLGAAERKAIFIKFGNDEKLIHAELNRLGNARESKGGAS